MNLEPVLVAGRWQPSSNPVDTIQAVNPTTGRPLPNRYPVSGWPEIERAVEAGAEAAEAMRDHSPDEIADFLEAYAEALEERQDALVAIAHRETALPPEPRLRSGELPRTVDQLRQAAAAARDRSWCRAILDTARNIRSMYEPLKGPVVTIGPSNFPYAFNAVSGGDFAAAVAVGNPVIAKGHPGHPGTTKLLAEAAFEAVTATGMPEATVQMIYHMEPESGLRLVAHPKIGASAFTGSRRAGMALRRAANEAGNLIYLEMSSINPVFVLPGALDERLESVAEALYHSCSLGTGQFCTKPGLVILMDSERSEAFIETVVERFAHPPGLLLAEEGVGSIAETVEGLQAHGAELITGGHRVDGAGFRYANTLLRVSGETFLDNPDALQAEVFGVVSLLVLAEDVVQMQRIAARLEGNLTGSVYTHTEGDDDALYDQVAPIVRERVGRLLNDTMPTGVAVSPAMNHGGPFPATGHPGFTAVGIPPAMLRFAALRCYDQVRHHRLPPELRNPNPTGSMWRLIDGVWTQRDVDAGEVGGEP